MVRLLFGIAICSVSCVALSPQSTRAPQSTQFNQSAQSDLMVKLKHQWQNYDKARELLLQHARMLSVAPSQRMISRQEWEKVITLQGGDVLTENDLANLRADQAARIQASRAESRRQSIIDLDVIRAFKLAGPLCEKLPKGGMLHIHPFGTLDRPLATQLLASDNPTLNIPDALHDIDQSNGNASLFPPERMWLSGLSATSTFLSLSSGDQARLATFLFLPAGKQPFSRFNAVFEFLGFAIPDETSYAKVLLNFARKATRDGVIYVEFTDTVSKDFLAELSSLESETGLTIRSNNSFFRTRSVETLAENWAQFIKQDFGVYNKYVVGIDLLDNEGTNPALEKGQLIYGSALLASTPNPGSLKFDLHRTMHAGEIGDVRNPRDAMIMGAQRLGHGVNLAKDPVALEYAVKLHEPVEINISSNLRLTDVKNVSTHPFLNYLRLGLPVSLSTDDEGIFDTDINNECRLAIEQSDVSYAEMKQMAYNSITTSFASAQDKKRLLAELDSKFKDFEVSIWSVLPADIARMAAHAPR